MRFRANIDGNPTFYNVMQTIERLQKQCIIRFEESMVCIICHGDESGVQVWSAIKTISLFTEYRIQSNSNNTITVQLSTDALVTALRSAYSPSSGPAADAGGLVGGTEVVMKLAKKNGRACLSFEILGSTRAMGHRLRVTQDVRVEVLRPADVERFHEPNCPEPDVQFLLPPLAKFRTVVERLRPLAADVLKFRVGAADGTFVLAAATDDAGIRVKWEGMEQFDKADRSRAGAGGIPKPMPRLRPRPRPEGADPKRTHEVVVSLKSITKFLSVHFVSSTVIGCICRGFCLILYVYVGTTGESGGVLTFYIPNIKID